MSIQDLGSLGEFVAAIVTIATLAYLAIQIRQNTAEMGRSELKSILAGFAAIRRSLYQDREVAEIFSKGMKDIDSLDDIDRTRFYAVMDDFFVVGMQVFGFASEGVIDPGTWEHVKEYLLNLLSTPGGQYWWREGSSTTFVPEFRQAIEEAQRDGI